MNKNKFTLGAFLIAVGLVSIFNVGVISLNDSHSESLGLVAKRNIAFAKEWSLPNYTSPGGNSNNTYCPGSYREEIRVHCQRTQSGTSGTASDWDIEAGVAAGWKSVNANVNGGYSSSGSSSGQVSITADWYATGVNCIPRYSIEVCTSHFPC